MKKAELYLNRRYTIGEIDPMMYSSFVEHLGRAVYTGLYQPGHPTADENGFRKDTMDAIQDLGVPMIRYPGGNFVSCYNWKDGIGPKEKRPRRMEYAWSSIETNQFGIDDFCRWAKKAGIEPMIAVNLGTGTIQDAGDLVEYCNHPSGTYWSDLRAQNGSPEPYKVKYWCLGNEMEGSWQAGHLSAEDYTKKALEAAKIMRWVDPDIKLIACGSSYEMLPTYLEWDRIMLDQLLDQVDYLSTHSYTMNAGQGDANFLAAYKALDTHIKNSKRVIEYVKARKNSQKELGICLDEWNVWNFQDIEFNSMDDLIGLTTFKITSAGKWEIAPPILQEKYSLLDALTVGGLAITLLKNADCVKIACLAQLVNVIAPITTDPNGGILRQSIYYPFRTVSQLGHGTVMDVRVDAPEYECQFGKLPVVEAVAVLNEEKGELNVFALNCDPDEDVTLSLAIDGESGYRVERHQALYGDNLSAINTFEQPDNVTMRELPAGETVTLPKMSWSAITLRKA
ncbi:MAG: alpha-N-arabinofuranosidase [Eubacteriales bacterium]|nr:alpha-N-arabinofuranosidase [Eubacteriales bacterium]